RGRSSNAAALGAETAFAHGRRHEMAEGIFALRYFYVSRFPESEGIDRCAKVGTAGLAMTVAHAFRCAGDFDLNGAAATFSRVFLSDNVIVNQRTAGARTSPSAFL